MVVRMRYVLLWSLIYSICNVSYGAIQMIKTSGLCLTDGLVKDVKEIQYCREIYGALEFAKGAKDSRTSEKLSITKIVGCVYVIETNLLNVDFLQSAKVECLQEGDSIIDRNPFLCIDESTVKVALTTNGIKHVNSKYHHCPVCTPETHKMPGSEDRLYNCATYTSSLVWAAPDYRFPVNLKVVDGRLVFRNVTFPDKMTFNIEVSSMEDSEPAVSIGNTSIPPLEIFKNLSIKTFARAAIEIYNITGYRMPREDHAFLSDQFHPKEIDADVEEDTDCFIKEEKMLPLHGLIKCRKMFGYILLRTDDNYSPADVSVMESDKDIHLYETDGDITRTFLNVTKVVLLKKAQIIIHLKTGYCFKAETIKMVRKWVPEKDRTRIFFDVSDCDTFIGPLTAYDVIFEDGSHVNTVTGSLQLADLSLHYPNLTRDGWLNDMGRFRNISWIRKSAEIPYDVPALEIKMCNERIKLPDFLFSVNISSERDDDLLVRVRGPGFRMDREQYDFLADKHGIDRLDIEKQFVTDCVLKNPVYNLSVLDECERIVGDFVLAENVTGTTIAKIKHVSGCIQIFNTDLELLDFFQFEEPYNPTACFTCSEKDLAFGIMNNTNLCLSRSMFDVDQELIRDNKLQCRATENTIFMRKHFVMYGPYNESEYVVMSKISELEGKIVVSQSDAEYLNLFPSLEKIIYTGSGAAIVIENNENLKEFLLPSLKEIEVNGDGQAIIMRNNPNLRMSENETIQFKKVAGNFGITMENEPVYDERRFDMWKGFGIGMGSGCGGFLAIAAVFATIVLVVHLVLHRNKSSKHKENPEKGKDKIMVKTSKTTAEEEKKRKKPSTFTKEKDKRLSK